MAILVSPSGNWGRQIVKGILSYANEHGPWNIWVRPSTPQVFEELPTGWEGDGVIGRVVSPKLAADITAAKIPTVNVADEPLPNFDAPCLRTDDGLGAKMAVEHFAERGLRQVAFVGPIFKTNPAWYAEEFARVARERGLTCRIYPMESESQSNLNDDFVRWLEGLPQPCGIFVWGHGYGREVVDRCRDRGISVPHDIAVLCGSYDELLSHACFPAMSGLIAPTEQIGYQSAELLDRMMKGETIRPMTRYLPPLGVRERPSTETMAVSDPKLVKVVNYIKRHALEPITVDDILREVPMARRSMERRFKQAFGRSPLEEIRRIRINRARLLLSETDLPMQEIAEACGYATYNYLTVVFKQVTGITPRDYRKQQMS